VVRVVGKHGAQQFAVPLVVGRLEAAQQLVERGEYLLGQLGRDKVLIFGKGKGKGKGDITDKI
jgi:hypothetical protein